MLTAFAFPLQVAYGSPTPAFLPYVFLGILFILVRYKKTYTSKIKWNISKPIIFTISIYLLLIIFNTTWQVIFGFITIMQGMSVVFIYVFPVLFFIYFRFLATSQQFRTLFFTMAIVGFSSGVYFLYDSYSMLVLHQLNDYSLRAFEYIQMRAPGVEPNRARISIGHRSHGLLEKHVHSASWIFFGCVATLAILPNKQVLKRQFVIMLFGLILLISLNITAIAGFVLIVLMMEYRVYYIFRVSTYKKILASLILLMAVGMVLFLVENPLNLMGLYESIENIITQQTALVTGAKEYGNENETYFGNLLYQLIYYPYLVVDFPIALLIGEGFSSFGRQSGGDFGVVDTLHKLGLPFFLMVFIGLIRLIYRSIKKINSNNIDRVEKKLLWFAASIVSYLLFTEVHYSVWGSKSVLPILFIALAIFDRYLYQSKVSYVDGQHRYQKSSKKVAKGLRVD